MSDYIENKKPIPMPTYAQVSMWKKGNDWLKQIAEEVRLNSLLAQR